MSILSELSPILISLVAGAVTVGVAWMQGRSVQRKLHAEVVVERDDRKECARSLLELVEHKLAECEKRSKIDRQEVIRLSEIVRKLVGTTQ